MIQKFTISDQVELLQRCIQDELDLAQELATMGLGYDNLHYRHNGNDEGENLFAPNELYTLRDYNAPENYDFPACQVPTIGFFSGGGGLEIGFKIAGFNHLASIEINDTFCDTLRQNNKHWNIIGPPGNTGDVCNKEEITDVLENKIGIKAPFEGVFHGGPPCQSFSIAANQRFSKSGDNFKRIGFQHDEFGNLLFEFVWYIKKFKPKAFLIENVVGLLSIDGGYQIEKTIKILQETGYKVTKAVLNAVHYGVPQSRLRLFIVGIRTKKNFNFPNKEVRAVASAKVLEKSLASVANHVTRHHRAQSIIRYMELRYGERDKLGRVDRINPNLPSKTVIAGGNRGGGRSHLHPHTPRTLSVRESARLQTFPDDYVFSGTPARQFTQVGNAVPPVLALKLARAIHSVF